VQPYGIAGRTLSGGREVIDLVDKTALLRLHDADGDDRFERTETLASGWGHSDDYHGWVVGLPQDRAGNYYVAVSQRGGPPEHLRGRVLRLAPVEPAGEVAGTALPYRIEPITAGHRYPAGIARNRGGALFVTDNQGNYNPFNELNHVQPGAHNGLIAKQDQPRPPGSRADRMSPSRIPGRGASTASAFWKLPLLSRKSRASCSGRLKGI